MSDAVSFPQISQILELTDDLEINREWVEIPLGAESPGVAVSRGIPRFTVGTPALGQQHLQRRHAGLFECVPQDRIAERLHRVAPLMSGRT